MKAAEEKEAIVLKKLSDYIFEKKINYIIAIASLISATLLDLLSPKLTNKVVDDVILGGNIAALKWILLGFLVFYLLVVVLQVSYLQVV